MASSFYRTSDFCPECSTILPVTGISDFVLCRKCSYSIPIEEFIGIKRESVSVFNKVKTKSELGREKDMKSMALSGPKIERKCERCGNDEMTYATMQTRSADEGQTVFYTCLKCRYVEIENS